MIKLLHTVSDNVREVEKLFIAHYKQFCSLVNGTSGGDGSAGHTMSLESRKKASELRMGISRSDYYKKILLTSLVDNSIIPCASAYDAALYLGSNIDSVKDAARGKRVKTIFNHTAQYQ